MKRSDTQSAGTIRFRFILSRRRWAVYLPHTGRETASFEQFHEAAQYAIAQRRQGQRIKWPCADELRHRINA